MKKRLISFLPGAILLSACASSAPETASTKASDASVMSVKELKAECERIEEIYPRLMLATMLEGDGICYNSISDENFPCNEGETAEEKAAREKRLEHRKKQELAAKKADMACDAFEEDLKNREIKDAALDAVAVYVSNRGKN